MRTTDNSLLAIILGWIFCNAGMRHCAVLTWSHTGGAGAVFEGAQLVDKPNPAYFIDATCESVQLHRLTLKAFFLTVRPVRREAQVSPWPLPGSSCLDTVERNRVRAYYVHCLDWTVGFLRNEIQRPLASLL